MTTGPHLNCTKCPDCGTKLQTKDSHPHDTYGFATVRRRKVCGSCGFRVSTVELQVTVADSLFMKEDE